MRCAVRYLGLLSLLVVRQLPAQSPPAGAVLEGDVVNAITGAPIPHARIKLEKLPADVYAKTDAQGHFQFAPVPLANYSWSAESPGFLPVERSAVNLGAPTAATPRRAPAEAAQVTRTDAADGTPHFKLTVPLTAYAVITGRVTDPSGLPAEDCRITVVAADGSAVRFAHTFAMLANQTRTNEKGEFRAAGLPPGTYYVSATGNFGGDTSFRTTYFPGALERTAAKPVQLVAGQSGRADIRLVQLSGVQITGRAIAPSGAPAGTGRVRTTVELVPAGATASDQNHVPGTLFAQDSFLFNNVLPGKYTLLALTSIQDEGERPREAKPVGGLMREVEVGSQNIHDLDLALQPLHDLSGTVTFGAGCSPQPVQISARSAGLGINTGALRAVASDADGKFVLAGLGVGTFTIETLPRTRPTVQIRSIRLGDRDVLRDGLQLPVAGDDPLLLTVDCATGAPARLP